MSVVETCVVLKVLSDKGFTVYLNKYLMMFIAKIATQRAMITRDIEKVSRFDTDLIALRESIVNNRWYKCTQQFIHRFFPG